MTEASKENFEPLISIIVPVYKVEKYIDRCVKSIINQTYKNIEIILVDDGSPDNCPKICDEFEKIDKKLFKKNNSKILIFSELFFIYFVYFLILKWFFYRCSSFSWIFFRSFFYFLNYYYFSFDICIF